MRRRQVAPAEPPPAELERFRLPEWWAPDADPLPAPWVPYDTDEDKFVYHAIKARRRWGEAHQEWRDAARERRGPPGG